MAKTSDVTNETVDIPPARQQEPAVVAVRLVAGAGASTVGGPEAVSANATLDMPAAPRDEGSQQVSHPNPAGATQAVGDQLQTVQWGEAVADPPPGTVAPTLQWEDLRKIQGDQNVKQPSAPQLQPMETLDFGGGVPPGKEKADIPVGQTKRGKALAAIPKVPGYEVLDELGRGGMGIVYKARQTKLNRFVALKMVLAGAHANADQLGRFYTEAEAVASLQHANIVQIYEVGEYKGLPFFSL
ncbi:MAG TPA: protein kinase, partial [Gemmataceae bacterium]|nr:protein kinase [Gemmataceae bacterium]